MKFTIQTAADFVRTGRASAALIKLLVAARRGLFTFTQEHANRLPRYVAVTQAYKRGRPVDDICAQFGCSKTTVLRYARLAGLPIRARGFDPQIRANVILLYKKKLPIAQIASNLGVSIAYVSKVASEEGIARRKFKKRSR